MSEKLRTARAEFGRPAKKVKKKSHLEERVAAYIGSAGLPQPIREFRFAPPRLFRFDFAWPALGIYLETEGGIWTKGGHTRGAGYADNCDKYNLAALHGWRGFRVTERQVRDGSAFELIQHIFAAEIRYVPTVLTEAQL